MASKTQTLDIIRGDDVTFEIQFVKENNLGVNEAVDITGFDITVTLPGEASDIVLTSSPAAGVTITDAVAGKVQVALTDVQSALLKRGDRQSFYVVLDNAGEETTVKFRNILNVDNRDFK